MQITSNSPICTVIVSVEGEADHISTVLEHAATGLELFSQFTGFIAGATHLSADGCRILQYLQWDCMENHDACIADRIWQEQESSKMFLKLVETGNIQLSVQSYAVIRSRN